MLHGIDTVNYFTPTTDPKIDFSKVDVLSLLMLERARSISKIVFKITSHYRIPDHSVDVGGSMTDAHTRIPCGAFDIAYSNSKDLYMILDGVVRAGFKRIGVNNHNFHVHVDNESSDHFPSPRFWIE